MPRKCTCCKLKNVEKLNAAILQGAGSARRVGEQFGVSKRAVLNHRSHIQGAELKQAHASRTREIEEILKRVDRLIRLFEAHLKQKPRSALSLDWIRESRDQRGWLMFRTKALGKIAPTGESAKREGDKFNVVFVDPSGKQVAIPLRAYAALPREVFDAGDAGSNKNSSHGPSKADQLSAEQPGLVAMK